MQPLEHAQFGAGIAEAIEDHDAQQLLGIEAAPAVAKDAAKFIATGHMGTPCPKPREGGLCGCDEDDFEPRDCYRGRCD